MANKTLHEFSTLGTENICSRPTLKTDNLEFELKPSLINMVQATHSVERHMKMLVLPIQNFLEISSTVVIKDVA